MSGDRCYVTVYPLKSLRHRTPRVAMIVSTCIWIGLPCSFNRNYSFIIFSLIAFALYWLIHSLQSVKKSIKVVYKHNFFEKLLFYPGSFILSTPILMYQRIEEGYWYGPRQYCMERFPSKTHERAFILYQFIAAYLLPVLTISFCYTLMVKRVGQPTVEPVDNNYQVWIAPVPLYLLSCWCWLSLKMCF